MTTLDLKNCPAFTALLGNIGSLKSLKALYIGHARIAELPESIGGLHALEELTVRYCYKLEKLPESIGRGLASLKVFNVDSCEGLLSIPDSVEDMVNLETFSCNYCVSLVTLPANFKDMKQLRELDVSQCFSLEKFA